MELDNGIYLALVTDNSNFFNTGKIRVRVQKFYNDTLNLDLSKNFDASKFNNEILQDFEALIYTPIGGGNNYGLFALPQINSVGIVQFLGGNFHNPIWMGSFFRPEYNEKEELVRVNVPNDQPLMEGLGSDGITRGSSDNYAKKRTKGGNGSIILRTKTTSGPGTDNNAQNMNFNKKRTENLMTLSDQDIKITHFSKWRDKGSGASLGDTADLDQYEEISVGTNREYDASGNVVKEYPQISISVKNDMLTASSTKSIGISLNPDAAILGFTSAYDKASSTISATPTGVTITSMNTNNSSKTTTYEMTPTQVKITNKAISIVVTDSEVLISAPEGKIRLSGKEIFLGDGGGYVMIQDVKKEVRLEDGSVLKASSVRA